jgi:hypothetical protein
MEMAVDRQAPTWRNALSWTGVGFVGCALTMLGAVSVLQPGGLPGLVERGAADPARVIVSLAAALILGSAMIGFTQRNSPFTPRSLRNFVLINVVFLGMLALAVWGYHALVDGSLPGAMDLSAKVALVLGLTLAGLALLSLAVVGAAHLPGSFLTDEQAEDTRDRRRVTLYSAAWMAAMGLTLALLSLAGPGGPVSPATALAGSAVLLGIATAADFAIRPLLDELWQALSRESGNAAFQIVFFLGGGWAILAHLGYVRAPAPLDLVTLFIAVSLIAGTVAVGRRGLFRSRTAE